MSLVPSEIRSVAITYQMHTVKTDWLCDVYGNVSLYLSENEGQSPNAVTFTLFFDVSRGYDPEKQDKNRGKGSSGYVVFPSSSSFYTSRLRLNRDDSRLWAARKYANKQE